MSIIKQNGKVANVYESLYCPKKNSTYKKLQFVKKKVSRL